MPLSRLRRANKNEIKIIGTFRAYISKEATSSLAPHTSIYRIIAGAVEVLYGPISHISTYEQLLVDTGNGYWWWWWWWLGGGISHNIHPTSTVLTHACTGGHTIIHRDPNVGEEAVCGAWIQIFWLLAREYPGRGACFVRLCVCLCVCVRIPQHEYF